MKPLTELLDRLERPHLGVLVRIVAVSGGRLGARLDECRELIQKGRLGFARGRELGIVVLRLDLDDSARLWQSRFNSLR